MTERIYNYIFYIHHAKFSITLVLMLRITKRSKIRDHCVKSFQIRSFFWSVFSCIQTEYGKIRTRTNFVLVCFENLSNCKKHLQKVLFMTKFGKKLCQDCIQHHCFPQAKLIFRVVLKPKQVMCLQQSLSSLTNLVFTSI